MLTVLIVGTMSLLDLRSSPDSDGARIATRVVGLLVTFVAMLVGLPIRQRNGDVPPVTDA